MQYVSYQLDMLGNMDSPATVREALNDLPRGLGATYERILLTLKSQVGDDHQPIRSMLMWLCVGNQTIHLRELAEIYVYSSRFWPPGNADRPARSPRRCERAPLV